MEIAKNEFNCSNLQEFFKSNEGKSLVNSLVVNAPFVTEIGNNRFVMCDGKQSINVNAIDTKKNVQNETSVKIKPIYMIVLIMIVIIFGISALICYVRFIKLKKMIEVRPYPTLAEMLAMSPIRNVQRLNDGYEIPKKLNETQTVRDDESSAESDHIYEEIRDPYSRENSYHSIVLPKRNESTQCTTEL